VAVLGGMGARRRASTALLATTVILGLGRLDTASGLSCHSCNSIYDRRCGDPYDAYTTEIVDCEQERRKLTHVEGIESFAAFCRKTVQTVDGEVRVHRSCGFVPNVGSTADRDCFTRTGTHQISVYHCVCKEDSCNKSSLPVSPSPTLLLFLPLLLLSIFFRSSQTSSTSIASLR